MSFLLAGQHVARPSNWFLWIIQPAYYTCYCWAFSYAASSDMNARPEKKHFVMSKSQLLQASTHDLQLWTVEIFASNHHFISLSTFFIFPFLFLLLLWLWTVVVRVRFSSSGRSRNNYYWWWWWWWQFSSPNQPVRSNLHDFQRLCLLFSGALSALLPSWQRIRISQSHISHRVTRCPPVSQPCRVPLTDVSCPQPVFGHRTSCAGRWQRRREWQSFQRQTLCRSDKVRWLFRWYAEQDLLLAAKRTWFDSTWN